MDELPPVPPRPVDYDARQSVEQPPPIPPLPPELLAQSQRQSLPHFEPPLAAPRPHRLDPNLPANMARTLDNQAAAPHQHQHDSYRAVSPCVQPPANYNPGGFAHPSQFQGRVSVQPPPNQAAWSAWNPASSPAAIPLPASPRPPQHHQPPPPQQRASASPAMATMSYQPQQPQIHPRSASVHPSYSPVQTPSPPRPVNGVPSLTAPLPSIQSLTAALPTIQQPHHDPALKINWARDVLMLVDRAQQNPSSSDSTAVGPVTIHDPQLLRLSQVAVPIVLQIASTQAPSPLPIYVAEAVYLRATMEASGAYPDHVPHNPRIAFRDFEQAARSGHAQAWFRLGRDYENFNDVAHARECFERGVKLNVESCVYRMGMAHLMGQLGLPAQTELAIPLLHRAATLASVQVPQPAYVYGLLLLGEFSHVAVPPQLFAPLIPPHSSIQQEARLHLERAAFLHFAPAQYKLGHAYEFALPPFPFDALLSVQYYSLASQQGEVEADMALSKWFLCGAEGAFDKDESLAYTFAEKASKKGLPSAQFAMGYYKEVGVGGSKDIEAARSWYQLAAEQGNSDAIERLAALSQASPQALSRQQHDDITEAKLVRKRTQAKQRSERTDGPAGAGRPSIEDGRQVVEVIRRNSVVRPSAQAPGPVSGPALPPVAEQAANSPSPRINQGPAAQPPRQFPNQHRYTLVDPGSNSAGGSPPPSRTQSPSYARPTGRPPGQRTGSGGPGQGVMSPPMPSSQVAEGEVPQQAPTRAHVKGPTTFAEMGIQGARLEEKECIIM
ncbi:HCP-like protein [Phlebopus sp. FC_14]|nr:HCP-like protein [Phlebopus sp. FC_14]